MTPEQTRWVRKIRRKLFAVNLQLHDVLREVDNNAEWPSALAGAETRSLYIAWETNRKALQALEEVL